MKKFGLRIFGQSKKSSMSTRGSRRWSFKSVRSVWFRIRFSNVSWDKMKLSVEVPKVSRQIFIQQNFCTSSEVVQYLQVSLSNENCSHHSPVLQHCLHILLPCSHDGHMTQREGHVISPMVHLRRTSY